MITVAACFYSPEDYEKLLEISDDRYSMCDTYAEWLVEFMKMRTGLEEKDMPVSPVRIKMDDLIKYCKENKLKNTGETRSKYASLLAQKLENTVLKGMKNNKPGNNGELLN